MPKQLTPQEKKRLSYEKDHIPQPESDKAFRKRWPLEKAWSKRIERHRVREKLTEDAIKGSDDERGDLAIKPVRRQKVRKYARVVTLREHVANQHGQRVGRYLYAFLKQPDSPENHARFAAFLDDVITTSKLEVRRIYAEEIADLLRETKVRHQVYRSQHEHEWIRGFLDAYPEWEPRLRAWIDETL